MDDEVDRGQGVDTVDTGRWSGQRAMKRRVVGVRGQGGQLVRSGDAKSDRWLELPCCF